MEGCTPVDSNQPVLGGVHLDEWMDEWVDEWKDVYL